MNVTNFVENFNSKIVNPGSGFHGERSHPALKTEQINSGKRSPEPDNVKKTVEELNRLSGRLNEKVQFSYDEKNNRVIIRVMDKDTNEVIREIPGKYSIRLLEHFREYLGLLIDESR